MAPSSTDTNFSTDAADLSRRGEFARRFTLQATVAPFFRDLLRAGRMRRGREPAERLRLHAA